MRKKMIVYVLFFVVQPFRRSIIIGIYTLNGKGKELFLAIINKESQVVRYENRYRDFLLCHVEMPALKRILHGSRKTTGSGPVQKSHNFRRHGLDGHPILISTIRDSLVFQVFTPDFRRTTVLSIVSITSVNTPRNGAIQHFRAIPRGVAGTP
jgi:hypothetical protein